MSSVNRSGDKVIWKFDHGRVLDFSILLHKKCCNGNPDGFFDRPFRELSNGTNPSFLSLIEVQIECFEGFTFAVTLAHTGNVDGNHNDSQRTSDGASTKYISQIEVEIKWFEGFILKKKKKPKMVAITTGLCCHGKNYD